MARVLTLRLRSAQLRIASRIVLASGVVVVVVSLLSGAAGSLTSTTIATTHAASELPPTLRQSQRPEFLPEERRKWAGGRPPGYRQDRTHNVKSKLLREADADGWELREMHPGRIHLEESCVRLGGADWSEVRRLALDAEDGIAELPVPEVRLEVLHKIIETGKRKKAGERCVVSSRHDLAVAYAARCMDRPLTVRYRSSEPSAKWLNKIQVAKALDEAYFGGMRRVTEEAAGLFDIKLVAGRPETARRQLLARLDVDCVSPTRRADAMRRPQFQKAWAYARRMLQGEWFPAIRVRWHNELGWQFSDGCHRCWAWRIAGLPLNVTLAAATLDLMKSCRAESQ